MNLFKAIAKELKQPRKRNFSLAILKFILFFNILISYHYHV